MHRKIELENLKKTAETVLQLAKRFGASEAGVMIESGDGFSVVARQRALESLEFHRGKTASVTFYAGKRCASASTTDLSDVSLEAMVKAASEIAQFAEEDPCHGLADADKLAKEYPDVDRYHPWNISPEDAAALTIETEAKALSQDKRIVNTDGVVLDTQETHFIAANTHGFCGEFSESSHALSCSLIAQDGKEMQRASSYTFASSPKQLDSSDDVAIAAAKKVVAQLNPKKLATQKTAVVFDAEMASHIFAYLTSAISGGNLYRQSTFLLDHLGKSVCPDWMSILENPHQKNVIGATPFDTDGVLTRKKHFVQHGVLASYALGSYSARRLGMETTANAGGVFNLSLETADPERLLPNQQALLKKMDRGVLITSMIGSTVSILTGDYSRGASGFWVENGEIQYPVQEFTIASNLRNMLMNIQAVAMDVDRRKNIKTGSLLIADMMIAGE